MKGVKGVQKRNARRTVTDIIVYSLLGIWSIIMFLIVAVNLNDGLNFSSVWVGILYIVLVILIIKYRKNILRFIHKHEKVAIIVCVLMIIIGIVVRLSLIFLENRFYIDIPLSDTGVHWEGAAQLVENGELNQEIGVYENFFPYLTSYTGTLGLAMNIIGDAYKAIIISNTFFDVISMIILFVLFTLWKKNKKAGLIAAAVWSFNPLQIIFCGVPMAIVITNTLVLLVILLVYLLYNYGRKNLWLGTILALCCGIGLAVGNEFRLIFTVFLVALILFYLYLAVKKEMKIVYAIAGCIVMVLSYVLTGMLWTNALSNVNPYSTGGGGDIGWSIFVGSNYETQGVWSLEDREIFFGGVMNSVDNDISLAQKKILLKGGERYVEMLTKGELSDHMINKTAVLFADIENSISDFRYNFHISKSPNALLGYSILQNIILIFYYSLLIVVGVFIIWIYQYNKIKEYCSKNTFILYIIIALIGLFMASLLVEVMNRYCLPFIAVLVVLAVNALCDIGKKTLSEK